MVVVILHIGEGDVTAGRWSNTSMVSLVLYSSGSGGVMMLVSGNNAAAVLIVLCSWNIGGRRKGPTTHRSIILCVSMLGAINSYNFIAMYSLK